MSTVEQRVPLTGTEYIPEPAKVPSGVKCSERSMMLSECTHKRVVVSDEGR